MDVTDIGKVASRKRINTDAERLREKVSRETAKIIKLKVAQDTAYWDLKERLQQLQGAHERLQQNMVDVQMQHEAASAHYAAELRLRPDTLNKLAGARGVCDVLEEYGARLRRCVLRGRADCAALQAAYGAAGARVRLLAAGRARAGREGAALAARRLAGAREQLGEARARAEERAAALGAQGARLQQAERAAAAMRDELSRLVRHLDAQAVHMQQTIARQEDEARAAGAQAAELRREAEARQAELRRAHELLADANNTIDHMKQEEATHIDEIKKLEKVINDKNQHEQEMETQINSIKESVRQLEAEKLEASEQLSKGEQENRALRTELGEHARAAELLRERLAAELAAHRAQRDADAARLDELGAQAAARQRELDAGTGTIARLMTDLKGESDARARCDAALGAARDSCARLELALKAKDDELGAQMTIILDMRGEKERLQERIQGMQNTIDNIQKELTGRLAAPKVAAYEPPELDAGPAEPEPRPAELYSFLSDGSVDGDALDPHEVGRRFEALARGELCGERDVRGVRARAAQDCISLSQVKDDLKIKGGRTFFKNKRFDSKPKKFK